MTSVFMTGGYFLAIYFVTFLYNLCKIHLSNPVELLHGTEAGEKEPKTKILMTLIGLCCIGFGYYFALTTKSPMAAMNTFFIAVILVVIGTYALFTAGSIALLKLMRKNKHFITGRDIFQYIRHDLQNEAECGRACQHLYIVNNGVNQHFNNRIIVCGNSDNNCGQKSERN